MSGCRTQPLACVTVVPGWHRSSAQGEDDPPPGAGSILVAEEATSDKQVILLHRTRKVQVGAQVYKISF